MTTARCAAAGTTRSSSTPGPARSSTIPRRSRRPRSPRPPRHWAGNAQQPSGSRTSGRRWWRGSARRAPLCTARSCGRTGARRPAAGSSRRRMAWTTWRGAPAWCGIPTSPPPRSNGSCGSVRVSRPGPRRPTAVLSGTMTALTCYRLSGGAAVVTDHTNASRTLLYNLRSRDWDAELLRLFAVPREALPDVVPSSGVCADGGRSRSSRHPHCRHCGGPAGGAVRAGLPRAGGSQEHLRDRRVPAHARGREGAGRARTGAHHHGLRRGQHYGPGGGGRDLT